jgi:hypothetical protein
MVEPVSDEERERTLLYVKVGLTVLVGLSAGLIAAQGEADPEVVGGAVVAGLVVGGALAWYLVPDAGAMSPASRRRYRK